MGVNTQVVMRSSINHQIWETKEEGAATIEEAEVVEEVVLLADAAEEENGRSLVSPWCQPKPQTTLAPTAGSKQH